ncbi:hypothetical protein BLD48_10000 [Exiguobacterium sp. KRL4]|uniref:hypothetical protein n=1 Tax=Exiguobacterium sp. KRL4 TaxID=1914536 RepID=UPI0008F80FF5|nr:hypothetical protein [Exiguobacterium sp. KRL4]OIN66638.1 hypothetical protein BLD48_10000 [Exiguobacterium sp. KRL4]
MNKQERIQTIKTIHKRTKPVRIACAGFFGIALFIILFFDQSLWSVVLLISALIAVGISLRNECLEVQRLSKSKQAKRLIQLRYTTNLGMMLILSFILIVLNSRIHYMIGFMIFAIVIETYLDRRISQADPDHPMSKEYR